MLIGILYFVIIIFANSLGAVSGMGGGVLIKPLFDLIGAHDVASISFYSAVAVFTMSIVSTYRQVKNGVQLNWINVFNLALGSVLGGYFGNYIFQFILETYQSEALTQGVQIIVTCLTLIFAFFYSRNPRLSFHFSHWLVYMGCGFFLGTLASLLGIGGGPINVSFLMLVFSMPIKDAAVYSICAIFFSQASKIVTIGLTTGYMIYDLSILLYVVPAAICGGLIGAKLGKVLSPNKVVIVFQTLIIVVFLINVYNGLKLL